MASILLCWKYDIDLDIGLVNAYLHEGYKEFPLLLVAPVCYDDGTFSGLFQRNHLLLEGGPGKEEESRVAIAME